MAACKVCGVKEDLAEPFIDGTCQNCLRKAAEVATPHSPRPSLVTVLVLIFVCAMLSGAVAIAVLAPRPQEEQRGYREVSAIAQEAEQHLTNVQKLNALLEEEKRYLEADLKRSSGVEFHRIRTKLDDNAKELDETSRQLSNAKEIVSKLRAEEEAARHREEAEESRVQKEREVKKLWDKAAKS